MKPQTIGRLLAMSVLGLLLSVGCSGAARAEPNDPYYLGTGTWGQDFADQWALKQLRAHAPAAANGARPVETVVAVIDTGLDYEHPDLAASQLWFNEKETRNGRDDDDNGYVDDLIGWNFVDGNNNPWDLSGHGTHIAGAIAACTNNQSGIAAVNPDARIMALKVANFAGQARSSAVASALYYAVDQGARVINLSLGGELATDLERQAATYAQKNGVLLVVSAGNRGLRADEQGYPGLPGALVVGASDLEGNRAGFSNFGSAIDVVAPGVDVLSLRARDTDFIGLSEPLDYEAGAATVGEDAAYYRASGTSFSAALVSGLASRLLSLRPQLTLAQLRNLIEQSAVDIEAQGIDQLSGFGRVDLVRAQSADPNVGVAARLSGVDLSLVDNQIMLTIVGRVSASNFSGAELQVRPQQMAEVAPLPPEKPLSKKEQRAKERAERQAERESKRRKKDEPPPFDPTAWQTLATIPKPVDQGPLTRLALDELIERTNGAQALGIAAAGRGSRGCRAGSHDGNGVTGNRSRWHRSRTMANWIPRLLLLIPACAGMSGLATAADDLDWSQPVELELPPPTREVQCAAGTNVQSLILKFGLSGAQQHKLGQNGTLLELPHQRRGLGTPAEHAVPGKGCRGLPYRDLPVHPAARGGPAGRWAQCRGRAGPDCSQPAGKTAQSECRRDRRYGSRSWPVSCHPPCGPA